MTTVVSIAGAAGTRLAAAYSHSQLVRSPEPTGRPPAIGISGSYGGLTVGDEAILTVMLEQLRYRVTPIAMATSHAAGVCGALAARSGRIPRRNPRARRPA